MPETRPAPVSDSICVAQAAVVANAGVVPGLERGRPLAPQEAHAAAPFWSRDLFLFGDSPQA